MSQTPSRPDQTATAPQAFRDALAELVQLGMRVARMLTAVADAETELAESAAQARVAEDVSPVATSLAEAIESDRASAAAAEARHAVVARAEAVADAFDRVARSVRLTMAMAERFDRGWARGGHSDDRQAMTQRQIVRGVADAVARQADRERAERLRDAPDTEDLLEDRSPEAILAIICRALRLDPVRMTIQSPLPDAISQAEIDEAVSPRWRKTGWTAPLPQRQPDG